MDDALPDLSDLDVAKWETQLRKGGLGLAVLAALWSGPIYGLEMLRRLADEGDIHVPEGTIYPLMNRLKTEGLVTSEWVESDAGHPRKYYRLTAKGRARLAGMARSWRSFAAGLDRLIAPVAQEGNDHG
jgi:PadR family transcriptional regulator PadR